jgi:probable HAF family extracellular repeat protein
MKSCTRIWSTAAALVAALTMSVGMAAQDNPSPDDRHKHKKYRLIDMGTFGGPASYLTLDGGVGHGARVLNNRGAVVGWADTSLQDPYSPLCFNADCFLSHAFRWKDGVLTDLGSLPGVNNSQASGINDAGLIVGLSQYGVVDPLINFPAGRAVLWNNHGITDLGTLGGYESNGISVNNAGEVIGFSTIDGPPDPYSFLVASIHPFIWRNGIMQDIGTLGGPDALPGFAPKLSGAVVGFSFIDSIPNPTTGVPTLHPFLWRNGHMRDIGSLGGTLCCSDALVANSSGQVASDSTLVGDVSSHPFLWDRGRLTDLGTFGGDNGFVHNVNDKGEVVGYADFPGDQVHDAFLWKHGRMIDLGKLGITSAAHAINNNGQIVGGSFIDDTGNIRAFVWENGGPMVDLNDLIPADSPLTLSVAWNINESGTITGVGVPAGCAPAERGSCGHVFALLPEGDCDPDNEARIAATQARVAAEHAADAQYFSTTKPDPESPLSPAERFRSMMSQRFHLPG